jgi:cytoskeletal protein CcmA (bactofilin family)
MARDIKEGRLSGFVGNGTVLTGETNFQAMLRVDGHLTGRVTSENGTLIIGSTGKVDANIAVAAAVVNGIVNGDIMATEKIEFGRTARVTGNVQTPCLVMEEGAILEGNCSMTQARETAEKRQMDSHRIIEGTYQNAIVGEAAEDISDTDDETAEAAVS